MKLAENLCKFAKDEDNLPDREKGNYFSYQVLESFDFVGTGVDSFHQSLYWPGIDQKSFVLRGYGANAAAKELGILKKKGEDGFPRRWSYNIVQALCAGKGKILDTDISKAREYYDLLSHDLDGLRKSFGNEEFPYYATWLHLAELWDYALEVR